MTLFYNYMGPSRVCIVILASVLMQVARTLMDNWLGIWFQLHAVTKTDVSADQTSTAIHVKELMLGFLTVTFSSWTAKSSDSSSSSSSAMQAIAIQNSIHNNSSSNMYNYSNNTIMNINRSNYNIIHNVLQFPAMSTLSSLLSLTSLSYWSKLYNQIAFSNFVQTLLFNLHDSMITQFLLSYAAIGLISTGLSFLRSRIFFRAYKRVANRLQQDVTHILFRAPVSYYDRVPSSTLIQVLSRDQQVVDYMLGQSIELVLLTILQLLSLIVFNAMRYAAFIVILPITVYLFYHLTLRFLVFIKQARTL